MSGVQWTPASVRALASQVTAAGPSLRRMESPRRVAALARAAAQLVTATAGAGSNDRARIAARAELSPEMVDWALRTTLRDADAPGLRHLAEGLMAPRRGAAPAPTRLAALVLAGNVFTACVRPVFRALLAGVPVIAKASSRDDALPLLLRGALRAADPDVGRAFEALSFPSESTDLVDALVAQADVVDAYGSDATLSRLRARLAASTVFVPHGHGVGVAHVPAEVAATGQQEEERIAERIALDVAAYDQRGCLSPHVVFVERGGRTPARDLARRLAEQLHRLARRLPRGPLSMEAGAAQLQWRGVAAVRGELFEGDGWAVSWEGDGPMRLSPGHRNVSVIECAGSEDLLGRLLPLGVHLKALGVAAGPGVRRDLAGRLPPPLCPRVSPVGVMQSPPLDSLADGCDAYAGLVRWSQVD